MDSLIKAAAVGGVAAMWTYSTIKIGRIWAYFTYETLKICDKIILPPAKPPSFRCEYCEEDEELENRYGDEKAA